MTRSEYLTHPQGWRRLRVGERARKGDWLDHRMFGDGWEKLVAREWGQRVQKSWRTILRRTTSKHCSPNGRAEMPRPKGGQ
jgi:hypothetical protein